MTDRPDPADWIANARSLAQSSSIPLGVPINTYLDMLLRDTRRDLRTACDALEAVLALHRLNREDDGDCQGYTSHGYGYLDRWCVECSEQSGREYGTPWPCPTVAAIESALRADS